MCAKKTTDTLGLDIPQIWTLTASILTRSCCL